MELWASIKQEANLTQETAKNSPLKKKIDIFVKYPLFLLQKNKPFDNLLTHLQAFSVLPHKNGRAKRSQ